MRRERPLSQKGGELSTHNYTYDRRLGEKIFERKERSGGIEDSAEGLDWPPRAPAAYVVVAAFAARRH